MISHCYGQFLENMTEFPNSISVIFHVQSFVFCFFKKDMTEFYQYDMAFFTSDINPLKISWQNNYIILKLKANKIRIKVKYKTPWS